MKYSGKGELFWRVLLGVVALAAVWASKPIAAWAASNRVTISLANADKLAFKLDARGAIDGCHRNIAYPVLALVGTGAAP